MKSTFEPSEQEFCKLGRDLTNPFVLVHSATDSLTSIQQLRVLDIKGVNSWLELNEIRVIIGLKRQQFRKN